MASVVQFLERQVLRAEVRWWHWSLDERLAAGFDPASNRALTMRAEQLCSPRHRRRLAAWVERLTRDAETGGGRSMSAAVPVVPEQVTEARHLLLELAKTLRETAYVRPRGVAMVQRLLSDSDSAVYTNTARGAVELQVQAALGALVERETAAEPAVIVESARPGTTTRPEARPRQRPTGGLA